MSAPNQQFARTVRIAIPLQEDDAGKPKIPKIAQKSKCRQTSWIVTQSDEAGADRYQELLHSLYDGVLITRASGQIVDVNARALTLLRYEQQELSRKNVMDIFAGANEELLKQICRNIETNRFTLIDAYCIRKDQTTFPAEIATNRLVLTKEGHLCFFLRDVTKRKKVEEELIQTVSKLKELDNAKSRLVANVSHELRTPLTIIASFVSLVHDGITGSITEQQKECLATVLRNCDRLANLIDDILDLGRIESGREEFKRRRLDLSGLLRQCHHDFLPKFLMKGQQFNMEIREDAFPDALGDADKISQVLTNLIGNAHKFTSDGGLITVSLNEDGQNARVDIVDNGPGIAPEDQDRLFEAFTQINRPDGGSGSKGTGLGLIISKHIIESHEGALKVESVPGSGSRFFFTLPLYSEKKALEAFINDRSRFMKSRNRKPVMVLLQFRPEAPATSGASSENDPLARQLLAAVIAALGCAELQTFLLESENMIMALTDRPDLNKETVINRVHSEISSRIQSCVPEVSIAYLQPNVNNPPLEWLERAKKSLEALPITQGPQQNKRVLVIDDDESVLKMITELLKQVDDRFEIRSTTSGYDACIHVGNWNPDLVILDLHLPDIDGKKVFQSMAKGHIDRRMKFLAVSGYPDAIREIMEMGCDDCLPKPFDFKQLIAKVKALLA